MKKMILLSLVTAAMLVTGCGEETKKAAEATVASKKTVMPAEEKVQKVSQESMNQSTGSMNDEDSAREDENITDMNATGVDDAMTETIQDAPETNDTVAATPAQEVTAVEAPAAYAKCAGCHGMDGKTKALGKSEIIAGQAKADLIAKINEYKAGSRNVASMGTLMQGQVAMLSDEDIQAIAAYISNLK